MIYAKQDQPGIYGRSLGGDVAKNPKQSTDYRAPWGGFYPLSDGIYYVAVTLTVSSRLSFLLVGD